MAIESKFDGAYPKLIIISIVKDRWQLSKKFGVEPTGLLMQCSRKMYVVLIKFQHLRLIVHWPFGSYALGVVLSRIVSLRYKP